MTAAAAAPRASPLPAGRGRWRLTLHSRAFTTPAYPTATGIGELVDARSRVLTQAWATPAQLTFSVDGHTANAATIRELQHDVIAWRYDETSGGDIPYFRGVITQSEDQISETAHTVNFTCHDYSALLARRFLTGPSLLVYGNPNPSVDQDNIVTDLLQKANLATNGTGATSFTPGSQLPLQVAKVNPDGSLRTALSGQVRDRSYAGGNVIGDLIDQLSKVANGFEYDVLPRSDLNGTDQLRIFFNAGQPGGPHQGIVRTSPALVYGSTISALTRSVNSADYGNYWRILGNNGQSDPTYAQLYADRWNSDANNVGVLPVGLWMSQDNAADVILQTTLNEKAQGDVNLYGLLMPSYSLTLRPGFFAHGLFNMGDTLPLVVQSGRLNVNTTVRILGITFTVGDDGQEDVAVVVGQPPYTLAKILTDAHTDINALARR
jgi:hypothetical protein